MIVISSTDPSYPRGLFDLADPPDAIWLEGDAAALARRPAVAIVGTRRLTAYGERVAGELGSALGRAGIVVVSGLAQGIDSTAQRAALEAGGASVGVPGEGIDAFFAATRGARARLARGCTVVSPYPPGSPAQRWTFIRRNAVIAALADAVVIVEAPLGSGALITAADARGLGRPLWAVAGPFGSAASAGSDRLLADGHARVLVGAADLVASLGVAGAEPARRRAWSAVAQALAAGPLTPDALAAELGIGVATLAARVALDGEVTILPDGRVTLAVGAGSLRSPVGVASGRAFRPPRPRSGTP